MSITVGSSPRRCCPLPKTKENKKPDAPSPCAAAFAHAPRATAAPYAAAGALAPLQLLAPCPPLAASAASERRRLPPQLPPSAAARALPAASAPLGPCHGRRASTRASHPHPRPRPPRRCPSGERRGEAMRRLRKGGGEGRTCGAGEAL
jgi:hypothetical protein